MAFVSRLWTFFSGDAKQLQKQADALKLGILGAANICDMALLKPASKLPNVLIYGVAARDRRRAEQFAQKHHIPKVSSCFSSDWFLRSTAAQVYDNYEQLLADPEIAMIYNPLPNGLHHQWTIKALRAGKHVLCEKPLSNNADEAREMVEVARQQNRLLVEAFHYRYHPLCNETLKTTLSNREELGTMQRVSCTFFVPSMFFKNDDIRFQYSIGGGAQMDLGCYLVSMCRFVVASYRSQPEGPFEVTKAEALRVSPANPQIDHGMRSEVTLDGIPCQMHCEFTNNWSFLKHEILIECEKVTITVAYLIGPSFYHYITVRDRQSGRTRTIKNYADNQSTYVFQLRAFIEAVKMAEQGSLEKAYQIAYTPGAEGIRNMEIIDEIYRRAGLIIRGTAIWICSMIVKMDVFFALI